MQHQIQPGDHIHLRAYGSEIIERVVVKADDEVVYVCRPSELEQATHENRAPMSIGFKRSAILQSEEKV
jgi:hypothetical protein